MCVCQTRKLELETDRSMQIDKREQTLGRKILNSRDRIFLLPFLPLPRNL